ncbi:MAG TPA: hypothetical protein VG841_13200 [Caulobacterales bacterium]|nr:hypothetical protein [Caulobacterales bacterium]
MFKPGGVLWLLRHELRVSWRGWRIGRNRGVSGRVILYIVLGVAMLAGGFGIATLLGEVQPEASPPIVGVLSAVFALIFTFMLSQALMLITESLYQRGDLDLLLASPIPTWRVLLVRMAAIALNVATLYLLLSGAIFVWLPFTGGWRWMGFAPSVLALALVSTAIALVIARLLFALIGPRSTRVAAQVLGALSGAAFFLGMQSQNFVPYEQRAQVFMRVISVLSTTLGDPRSPTSLPARAALGEPLALGLWIGLAIVAYVAAVWWFARRFVANAAAIAGMSGKKRADLRVRAIQGGLTRTLVRKEWRLLLRDPLLLSQILLQLLYLLPLVFVIYRGVTFGEMDRARVALLSGAFVVLASILSASLVWLTVSAEDAPDLITAAPVARSKIEHAKAIAAALPVIVLMLAPSIAAAFVAPTAGVWLFLGTSAAIVSAALVGIWHQAPGSRKNFRRRAGLSLIARIGQSILTFAWAAATGLAVFGWPWASLIPGLIGVGVLLALQESRIKPEVA